MTFKPIQTLTGSSNQFGQSVAIQGSTIVVGDSGDQKAHIYQKVGNHYKPIQVLTGRVVISEQCRDSRFYYSCRRFW